MSSKSRSPEEKKSSRSKRPLKRVRTSSLGRSLLLAGAGTEAGLRWLRHNVTSTFTPKEKKAEQDFSHLLSQFSALVDVLGELKGTFTKAGQMLSVLGEHVLPPEVNQILKSLQAETPPIEWKSMRRVLEKELGKTNLAALELNSEPIATASIGQVYYARERKTGREFALKVQMPGIADSVESDLKLLARLFGLLKLFSEAPYDWNPVLEEIREMMLQETDYEREFAWTARFRQRLAADSRFRVPEPIAEYSSKRILCTEFTRGAAIDSAAVTALPQERRNRLGYAAVELFLTELFAWGEVQTDPHFGNYRIELGEGSEQDRLILFDFGAVRAFTPSFLRHYRRMIRGAWLRNPEMIRQGILANGFLKESDPEELWTLLLDILENFMEPYRPESFTGTTYDFGKSDLPQRVLSRGPEIFRKFRLRPPPRELIFLDRRLGGTYVLIAKLGAQLDCRPLLERFLGRDA